MAKKKMGLSDRLNNINKNKNNKVNVVSPKPVIQEAKVPKKQGRPTYKKEGVKYERIFTDIRCHRRIRGETSGIISFRFLN